MSNPEPYYTLVNAFPTTNTEKGRLGEEAFKESLSDFPILMNITYGKRQKDIDHLVFTGKSVIMNECKNNKESFFMYYPWFEDRVFNRFVEGLPIAQFYAHTLGYPTKVIFTLTIPYLNTEPIVKKTISELGIKLIRTGKQLLKEGDKASWYVPVRRQILSVINNQTKNIKDLGCYNTINNNETKETTDGSTPRTQEHHDSGDVDSNSGKEMEGTNIDSNLKDPKQTPDNSSEIPHRIEEKLEQLSKDSGYALEKNQNKVSNILRWNSEAEPRDSQSSQPSLQEDVFRNQGGIREKKEQEKEEQDTTEKTAKIQKILKGCRHRTRTRTLPLLHEF